MQITQSPGESDNHFPMERFKAGGFFFFLKPHVLFKPDPPQTTPHLSASAAVSFGAALLSRRLTVHLRSITLSLSEDALHTLNFQPGKRAFRERIQPPVSLLQAQLQGTNPPASGCPVTSSAGRSDGDRLLPSTALPSCPEEGGAASAPRRLP